MNFYGNSNVEAVLKDTYYVLRKRKEAQNASRRKPKNNQGSYGRKP